VEQNKEHKINYILKRMPHHSQHSGYDQLVKYINCRIIKPNLLYRILDCCPDKILTLLSITAGYSWYNPTSFKQELQNIPDFIFNRNRIYHFLYGDDIFHYSGYLNPKRSNKLVASFHLPPEKFLQVTPRTRHLKKLDAAIVVAPNQLSLFKDISGPEKVHLIPHGINTHIFRPSKTESTKKRCIFVGSHMRDFEMLKNVIREINKKDSSISFDIVTLQKNCIGFNNLKNVTCYFSISEEQLINLYNTADLLLMPVKDSTANNSLLEAMACGLPVVSTKSTGLSYYLNNRCSIEVEPGDVSKMADAVLEIINNTKLQSSMSLEARKKALEFAWDIVAAQTMELYDKLLS